MRPIVLGLVLVACGGPSTGEDAGMPPDAALDAGAVELSPAVPCSDVLDDVYVTPAGLSPTTPETRGEIVRCAYEGPISQSDLAARLAAMAISIEPTTGANVYRVAYRTTRRGDVSAIASARVLLPQGARTTPAPVYVAAHGTIGLADTCAPSRVEGAADGLTLPWVARGFPVIAPDYAGLGTDGVQGYGDNDDTARSTLDAARALRALLPSGALSTQIVMGGHSQGGGSVLSAQALEPSYGAGGDLVLVIPFAPGWAIGRDATAYRFPAVLTSVGAGVPAAIGSMFLYAWAANTLGPTHVGDVFGATSRDAIVAALERDCILGLAVSIPAAAPTFGDLIDDTLRTGVVSCADGGACTGNAQVLWDWLGANPLHGDPSGASILLYTGTFDTLATPANVACIVDYLRGDGVEPSLCVDGSTHFNVVANASAYAIEYAEAMLAAAPLPPCPSSNTLPACGL